MRALLRSAAQRSFLGQAATQYRQASRAQKRSLLDTRVWVTGYVRKDALWLLNHPAEATPSPRSHPLYSGPEVQQALVLAWTVANQICAKRLIPFLPSLAAAWLTYCEHEQLMFTRGQP